MKLVLQRADGDCALAAIATLSEQPYEDVFLEAAKVEPLFRGRSGLFIAHYQAICQRLGLRMRQRTLAELDDLIGTEGLLAVKWKRGSRHKAGMYHLVALSYGVVADSFDGLVLPLEEYLLREKAKPGAFLEWRS